MSQYFLKPHEPFGGDINVKVDLSNYTPKSDIKNISHVDTSSFALKTNLATLNTKVNKLDIDKLAPAPVDLSKVSDVVKKTEYDKLVAKVNNIDTGGFVLKIKYDMDKSKLENKILILVVLLKRQIIILKSRVKEGEIEGKIEGKTLDVSNLATKTASH